MRSFDLSIAAPGREIRIPTVIVSCNYGGMPVWRPSVTRNAIFERDGGVCQYSGRKVGWREGNLDHVVPRSKGGGKTFEYLVWADRTINSRKGDRFPNEAGLKLIRQPEVPEPVPAFRRFCSSLTNKQSRESPRTPTMEVRGSCGRERHTNI